MARIQMLVDGWQAISPVAGSGIEGTCFIAMSFDDDLDPAYDDDRDKSWGHSLGRIQVERVNFLRKSPTPGWRNWQTHGT
jgi:hypothetical protein